MADFIMKNINKSFPGVKALDNANFQADRGDIVALLGENGAGKSTLIKVLCGEYKPDGGEIIFEGKRLKIRNTKSAIEQGICAVYQELSLVPELTIAQNLFLGFYETKTAGMISEKEMEEKTIALFERYGAEQMDPTLQVKKLSLAQKQVLEILKALNRNGEIIIFDEATSALTEKNANWLMDIIRQLAKEKKVIIFISHRLDEIRKLCNRVIVFRAGTDVADKKMEEVTNDELVTLMLGREIGGYYPQKENFVSEDVAIEMQHVTSGHKLINVDLKLRKGEILGVGGLAGQGQSELFLSLFGLIPYKGDIVINGKIIKLRSPRDAMKEGIALIPEERGLQGVVLAQTIRENIVLSSLNRIKNKIFLSSSKEKAIVSEMMKAFAVKAESPETIVGTLSGGNQQKVVLAKQLATNPDILLMFDITRGVDVGTKKEMFHVVKKYASQGKAILFFSTDTEELVNVCNSIVVMNHGRIAGRIDSEDLITRENIIRISMGEKIGQEGIKNGE